MPLKILFLFTLHSATIKTRKVLNLIMDSLKFTLHSATIKTLTKVTNLKEFKEFTLHSATIKTFNTGTVSAVN